MLTAVLTYMLFVLTRIICVAGGNSPPSQRAAIAKGRHRKKWSVQN